MISHSTPSVKNVVHVIGNLDHRVGGPRASLLTLIRHTGEQIYVKHHIICQFDTKTEYEEFERELRYPVLRIMSGALSPFNYWRELSNIRKQTTGLIIHVHGLFGFYPLIAVLFARLHRVTCVLSPRGMTMRLHGSSWKAYLKRAIVKLFNRLMSSFGTIHATSDQEIELFLEQFNRCRLIKATSADCDFGINLSHEYKPAERPYFIYLGRISSSKNVDVLIQAWLSLSPNQKKNYQLLLVGPVDKEFQFSNSELSEFRHHGIKYNGPVYKLKEKIELINRSRYLVNFSISENFGHSIFEALCLGVPVLVSNATPWNQVEMRGAGMVFDPQSVDFVDILVRCVELNDDELSKAAKATKSFVAEYKKANNSNLDDLYEFRHA